MGQTCSCDNCGKPSHQSTPDTNRRRENYSEEELNSVTEEDSDYDSDDPSSTSKYLDTVDRSHRDSSASPRDHTEELKQKGISGFKEAILNGNDSLVMYFVEEYPELDLLTLEFENGDNCLQVAVRNCSYNLIYYLLTNGISPNDQNPNNGESALHTAVRVRDVKIVALLCKYGADPKITNREFETSIAIASENRDDDIIELLAPDTQKIIRKRLASGADRDEYQKKLKDQTKALGFRSTSLDSDDNNNHNQQSSANYDAIADDILSDDGQLNSDNKEDDDDEARDGLAELIDFDSTFDDNLNPMEKKRLNTMRIARTNPFSKLKRETTKKILQDIHEIADNKDHLPVLEAWLEKKSTSLAKGYQRRWVIVRGSHLLWSDIQRDITNPKDAKERRKFNNSINIMSIKDIAPVTKGKTQRKFTLTVGTSGIKHKSKEYLWKCATKEDRDYWVNGLKKYVNHMKSVVAYLGTK